MYQNGDVIKSRSYWPFAYHYSIVLGEGPLHEQSVIHTMPETGPIKEPLEKFLNDRTIVEIIKTGLNELQPEEIEEKFNDYSGEKFDMIFNNCEVFVNKLLGIHESSLQVDIWLFSIALLIVLIMFVF